MAFRAAMLTLGKPRPCDWRMQSNSKSLSAPMIYHILHQRGRTKLVTREPHLPISECLLHQKNAFQQLSLRELQMEQSCVPTLEIALSAMVFSSTTSRSSKSRGKHLSNIKNDASAPKSRDYSSWLSRSPICSKKFDIPELATSELVAGVNDLSYHSKYVEHISNDITAMVLTQASPFHDKPAMKNQVRKTQWCA